MRKILIALLAGTALLGSALPASAAKKIHGSFTAQAIPFPNLSSATGTENQSCFAGVEGVHKVSKLFKAPAAGLLKATMAGFDGDWDLALADTKGKVIVSSLNEQVPPGGVTTEVVSLPMKKGQKYNIVACNFAGGPEAEVHYMFTFRR